MLPSLLHSKNVIASNAFWRSINRVPNKNRQQVFVGVQQQQIESFCILQSRHTQLK
jgi:hypothetical protein